LWKLTKHSGAELEKIEHMNGEKIRKGKRLIKHIPNTSQRTLVSQIKENIDIKAHMMTDEHPAYQNLYQDGYFIIIQ
jgi:IS1 family transposase